MAKKQTKKRTSKKKDDNFHPKLFIIVASLAVIIVLAAIVNMAVVGKAIETPQAEAVNLDLYSFETIRVATVPEIRISLTATVVEEPVEYKILLVDGDNEQIEYEFYDLANVLLAKGLLAENQGATNLYLDGDELADVSVSYSTDYFKVENPNYQEPDVAEITLVGATKQSRFITTLENKPVHLSFKAESNFLPTLSAYVNGELVTEEFFTENKSGEDYVIMDLDWTFETEGAHILSIEATVAGKSSSKEYIVGVGGIIYALMEDNLPNMTAKKVGPNEINLVYHLKKSTDLQPLSLPCGKVNFGSVLFPINKVDTVYRYENGIQQWKKNAPSEFNKLEGNLGYLIKLKKDVGPINFTVKCPIGTTGILPPNPSAQTIKLVDGWNFIGIKGYDPVPLQKLQGKTPAYKTITKIYNYDDNGADLNDELVSEFLPGRAYWLFVE